MNKEDRNKFIKSFFEFLDSDSGESLDELKEELKDAGIDFDTAEARLQNTLSQLIQKKKAEVRGREREEMLAERAQFERFVNEQKLPKDRKSRWEEINRIRNEYPRLELKFASRNFDNMSDEDLGKFLIELRALTRKDNF